MPSYATSAALRPKLLKMATVAKTFQVSVVIRGQPARQQYLNRRVVMNHLRRDHAPGRPTTAAKRFKLSVPDGRRRPLTGCVEIF